MEGAGGGFGTLELFAVANLRIRNKEFFISFSYKERFSLFATVFFKNAIFSFQAFGVVGYWNSSGFVFYWVRY
jgi:hypothetical protein